MQAAKSEPSAEEPRDQSSLGHKGGSNPEQGTKIHGHSETPANTDGCSDTASRTSSQSADRPARVYRLNEVEVFNEFGMDVMINDFDPAHTKRIWASNAHLKQFKSTLEDYLAKDLAKMMSAAVRSAVDKMYTVVQVQKQPLSHTKTLYPDGEEPVTMQMNMRPMTIVLPDFPEGKTVILCHNQPLSRSNETEKLQLRSAELIHYSEVPSMIFRQEDGELLFQNMASEVFYYGSEGEPGFVVDRKMILDDVFDTGIWESEDERDVLLASVRDLDEKTKTIEFEIRRKPRPIGYGSLEQSQPRHSWQRITISRIKDPASAKPAYMVSEFDISELKWVQSDLLNANRVQEQFFAATSHELRTPLNGIIGLSDGLLNNPRCPCPPEMIKSLTAIKSSGMRLAGLVNDVLDSAAARLKSLVIKHEPVDIATVVGHVVELCGSLVKKDVKLVNTVSQRLPIIQGDSDRINQVITNLVSNAIKFTHKGEIKIGASLVKRSAIKLTVSDTGIGIPAEKVECIWEAFSQVDMTISRKYGGTGLGLSVVKELVEAHRGTVSVESVNNGEKTGTTFTVCLPLRQDRSLRTEDMENNGEGDSASLEDIPFSDGMSQSDANQLSIRGQIMIHDSMSNSGSDGNPATRKSSSQTGSFKSWKTAAVQTDLCSLSFHSNLAEQTSDQDLGSQKAIRHSSFGPISSEANTGCCNCAALMQGNAILTTTYEELRSRYFDSLKQTEMLKSQQERLIESCDAAYQLLSKMGAGHTANLQGHPMTQRPRTLGTDSRAQPAHDGHHGVYAAGHRPGNHNFSQRPLSSAHPHAQSPGDWRQSPSEFYVPSAPHLREHSNGWAPPHRQLLQGFTVSRSDGMGAFGNGNDLYRR